MSKFKEKITESLTEAHWDALIFINTTPPGELVPNDLSDACIDLLDMGLAGIKLTPSGIIVVDYFKSKNDKVEIPVHTILDDTDDGDIRGTRSLSGLKSLDMFLDEEGIREEVTESALKRCGGPDSPKPVLSDQKVKETHREITKCDNIDKLPSPVITEEMVRRACTGMVYISKSDWVQITTNLNTELVSAQAEVVEGAIEKPAVPELAPTDEQIIENCARLMEVWGWMDTANRLRRRDLSESSRAFLDEYRRQISSNY